MKYNHLRYEEMIIENKVLWGHSHKEKDAETLKEHMDKVYGYIYEIDASNNALQKIKNIINVIVDTCDFKYKEEAVTIIMEGFLNAIYLHDMGKISPGYQKGVLDNPSFKDFDLENVGTEHSPYSSIIYLNEMGCKIASEYNRSDQLGFLAIHNIVLNFSYAIYTHHSGLGNMESYLEKLKAMLLDLDKGTNNGKISKVELENYKNTFTGIKIFNKFVALNPEFKNALNKFLSKIYSELFMLEKILYSMLVTCDTLATAEFMNGAKVDIVKADPTTIMSNYYQTGLYKGIEEHFENGKFNGTINEIRCEIFKESTDSLINNIDKNIFYLEAPTGSGKTNISTNLAFTSISECSNNPDMELLDKIIYTAPFNAITTQVSKFLGDLFNGKEVIDSVEINSYTPIKLDSKTEEPNYDISLLDYQLMNYPLVLTSHVNLFSVLFGTSRGDNYSLINLFNSVIIIDEVQAYKIGAWRNMIKMFDMYAKYMNIKFIIMSATLPKIDSLLDENEVLSSYVNLIEDCTKYFENKFFKNRIKEYDYSMVDEKYNNKIGSEEYRLEVFENLKTKIDEIYKVRKNSKVLIEFISRKSARAFYNWLKEYALSCPIREITGDDNKLYKERVIAEIKSLESILVVATQTIEAGVDIDMDFGFKDISYLDSEEQFLGRINRSNRLDNDYSKVYFFNLDEADKIYGKGGDNYKAGFGLKSKDYRDCLENKNFKTAFGDLLNVVGKGIGRDNAKDSSEIFDSRVASLNFYSIEEMLRLIDRKENECILYFPVKIQLTTEQLKESKFPKEILTDSCLDGAKVWKKLRECMHIKEYAERKVLLSEVMCYLGYFSYKIPYYKDNNLYGDELALKGLKFDYLQGIYHIDISNVNVDIFMDKDFKFNYEEFKNYSANMIL